MQKSATTATERLTLLAAPAHAGQLIDDDPAFDRLSQLITLAEDGAPPTEFRLLAAGENRTTKGTINCDDAHATLCLSAETMPSDGLLPLDYDHDMVSFLGANKRAAGWFKLANRNGSLWATDVKFTPAAEKALKDREYRYFSPALFRDEDGYVTRIVNCALTCLPATIKQKPLVAAEHTGDPEDMTLEQLCAAFGVANATQLAAKFTQLGADFARVQGENSTLVTAAQKLSGEIATLQAAVNARVEADAKAEKTALVTQLSADGKLPPAMHAWAATQTVEQLRLYAQHAPVIGTVSQSVKPAATDPTGQSVELSAEEAKVCAQMKLSAKDFLAAKAYQATQANPYAVTVDPTEKKVA